MYHSSHPLIMNAVCNKRKETSHIEQEIIGPLDTNQTRIHSPKMGHDIIIDNNNKRPRYESNWTLDDLCTHPCSPLASIDLESVFNMSTFQLLSQDKRDELCSLVPEIDQSTLLNHQNDYYEGNSYLNHHNIDYYNYYHNQPYSPYQCQIGNGHSNFFSKAGNPVFWNSLTEWQAMLSQSELIDQADSPPLTLSPPVTSTRNNSTASNKSTTSSSSSYRIHKPTMNKSSSNRLNHPSSSLSTKKSKLKDDTAFEPYWSELTDKDKAHNVAGESKSITLKDMCRKGLIREQDVIVYKRNFSASKVVVSKSMTVVKACGFSGISIKLDEDIFEDFETPTALETKILDHHGKVTKDKRPNGNAFKSIRLIRDGKDMGRLFDIRKDGFGDQI
ncbi:uncharacterized protein BX663DRAFT_477505 [Cokeromyces recurvatus]|uniref:uncharacterized protein n=1 Tax=Cokeromyces recurvatus TaxID=90255 RepID=UPI00221ED57A|nr:uncharacterized protein BX663DRAFT_477505 [Cokeromyces recurvatus]KAI7899952.1 hypothetical protein BX663DRAFT_477505 [Cokeromyces recurvatus]